MSKTWRALGFLVGANVQALSLLLFGYWIGQYLNKEFPKSWNWMYIMIGTAFLVAVYGYFIVVKKLLDIERNEKKTRI